MINGEVLSAGLIIIGNEILSGETSDSHVRFLSLNLREMGIKVKVVIMIEDDKRSIISAVNSMRKAHKYVFLTGGIGPTHDDVTTAAVAEAFGLPLQLDVETKKELELFYRNRGEVMNEARTKMAYLPKGASLIKNKISVASGFNLSNVYVFAGIPSVMQAMFREVRDSIVAGDAILSASISFMVSESHIADIVGKMQQKYKNVDIGSYPFVRLGSTGTDIVIRTTSKESMDQIKSDITTAVNSFLEENGLLKSNSLGTNTLVLKKQDNCNPTKTDAVAKDASLPSIKAKASSGKSKSTPSRSSLSLGSKSGHSSASVPKNKANKAPKPVTKASKSVTKKSKSTQSTKNLRPL